MLMPPAAPIWTGKDDDGDHSVPATRASRKRIVSSSATAPRSKKKQTHGPSLASEAALSRRQTRSQRCTGLHMHVSREELRWQAEEKLRSWRRKDGKKDLTFWGGVAGDGNDRYILIPNPTSCAELDDAESKARFTELVQTFPKPGTGRHCNLRWQPAADRWGRNMTTRMCLGSHKCWEKDAMDELVEGRLRAVGYDGDWLPSYVMTLRDLDRDPGFHRDSTAFAIVALDPDFPATLRLAEPGSGREPEKFTDVVIPFGAMLLCGTNVWHRSTQTSGDRVHLMLGFPWEELCHRREYTQ